MQLAGKLFLRCVRILSRTLHNMLYNYIMRGKCVCARDRFYMRFNVCARVVYMSLCYVCTLFVSARKKLRC